MIQKNKLFWKLIFEGFITLISMILMFVSFSINIPNHYIFSLFMFIMATFLVFFLEVSKFKNYKQIVDLNFNMDFLITLAIHITYFYSLIISIINIVNSGIKSLSMEFWEVPYALSFFIGIGHMIEDRLKLKTSLGIKELLKLQNKTVQILVDGQYLDVKSSQIKEGDIIKVNKGSSIPTDGILISNYAFLDYSSLLGESIPKKINKNEIVLSGSINIEDFIIYRATKSAKDSTLLKIISQLENIMMQKSNIERTSEKIVKIFLPTILTISLLTTVIWIILGYVDITIPKEFIKYDNLWTNAIYHGVAALVIACPCAFGIAAPAAIYSSSGIASKNKILFSTPKIYEMINKIKYVAFDKIGTITEGRPKVIKFQSLFENYQIIYDIANHSSHPMSIAIKRFLETKKTIKKYQINFDYIKEIPGIGIIANNEKNTYFLGSIKYAKEHKFIFNDRLDFEENINTIFAVNNQVMALFKIDDKIKNDAKKTIEKFHKMKIKTIILSGDKISKVEDVAKKLNIDYWYGELLPDQKSKIINDFKKDGDIIFVGDGINDILAIKSATIGISYASGSEITNSISDISLIENDLNLVYKAMMLAKRTLKLVRRNFIWAIFFNLLCIPLAILGLIPPWLGAILMISSTIFLLINTLISQHKNKKFISGNF